MSNRYRIKNDGIRAVFTITLVLILVAPVAYVLIIAASHALKDIDEASISSGYDGWKTVTVCTETPAQGTVMIPEGMDFVCRDGWMYLEETESGRIVAYQAFRGDRYYDYGKITFGYRNVVYNPLLPEALHDTSLFAEPKGEGSAKYNEIPTENGTCLAGVMEICYISADNDTEMLVMVFDDTVMDGKEIRKMLKTFVWGGIVK